MSTTSNIPDLQCVLPRGDHGEAHQPDQNIITHKCQGTLDCPFCAGYYLPEFDRCLAVQMTVAVWVEQEKKHHCEEDCICPHKNDECPCLSECDYCQSLEVEDK